MFKLNIIQAEFGDSFILEFGTPSDPHYVLIDGGPDMVYEKHLKSVLKGIKQAGYDLDLVVLSHDDDDHVVGLKDYFAELRLANHGLPLPKGLWYNSFAGTIGQGNDIETRIRSLITATRANVMSNSGVMLQGIADGIELRRAALALQIPINEYFVDELISLDTVPQTLHFANADFLIVGPTKATLNDLRQKWADWLDEHENAIVSDDIYVMANSDRTIPNRSSIMILVKADNKTILLTGDGRSDHLLEGLGQANLLNDAGCLHVDVLKLPHHGSERNVTKAFFKKVTADTYIISANGKDDNPDMAMLIWIAEAAKSQKRKINIIATNRTESTQRLLREYPKEKYRYTMDDISLRNKDCKIITI